MHGNSSCVLHTRDATGRGLRCVNKYMMQGRFAGGGTSYNEGPDGRFYDSLYVDLGS